MATARIIHGQRVEYEFVYAVCHRIGIKDIKINPKRKYDPLLPTLIVEHRIADVIYTSAPFFRSDELYGIDPRYAVTVSHKEFHRLRRGWPWMDLFFWVEWTQPVATVGRKKYQVLPMAGVWRTSHKQMRQLIAQKKARLYMPHGKQSGMYVFDLNDFECLEQVDTPIPVDLCFLDLETSGFSIKKGATMLAIGAVLRSGPEFYSLVRPTETQWWAANRKALETNGLTWEQMREAPILPAARHKFIEFLKKHNIRRGYALFVGQYPHFDMRYLKHTMRMHLDNIDAPIYKPLDIRGLYRMLANWGRVPQLEYYSGHEISKALGVQEEPLPHNALEGARAAMRNFNALDLLMG